MHEYGIIKQESELVSKYGCVKMGMEDCKR